MEDRRAVSKTGKRVAIIHYHLRRGGVTRVIEAAATALVKRGHSVVVLSGEAAYPEAQIPGVKVVAALQYRRSGSPEMAENLADRLMRIATAELGGAPDIWHFHNPTLAKNVLLPTTIQSLASQGARLLLQIHDFAEDGRPGNYASQRAYFDSLKAFRETMYPIAKHVHYATLNRRDRDILRAVGAPSANLHIIPNAVPDLLTTTNPTERPFSQEKLFAFYPTRGIRRKNLGELLLLALAYRDQVDFATSMRPENTEWMAIHDAWENLARELELPVHLGIADAGSYAFTDLLGWSDFIVTTSVAEGFGLIYLEPWIAEKPLMGRDLPEITRDFAARGIHLDHLYRRIDVPLDWIGSDSLDRATESMLSRTYLAYDSPLPRSAKKVSLRHWIQKDRIDFGLLDESFQEKVLRRIAEDPKLLHEIELPMLPVIPAQEIEKRRDLVRSTYHLDQYGDLLGDTYARIMHSGIGKIRSLSTEKLLDQFLDPRRLSLLRNG